MVKEKSSCKVSAWGWGAFSCAVPQKKVVRDGAVSSESVFNHHTKPFYEQSKSN